MLQVAGRGFAMLLRFARAYPFTALIAAAIYGGTALISTQALAALLPAGWAWWYVASWVGSLPRTVLLVPVLTALLRFVVVGPERRSYFTFDFRLLRVLRVELVLWAILFAGGVVPALSLDVLPHFLSGRRAMAALGATLITKLLAWWLALRLAIAPTLAAAGTRPYPLDTSLAFTRGWFFLLLGVRLVIWLVYLLPLLAVVVANDWDARALAAIDAKPAWTAAMTALLAVVELTEGAAMAVMTQRIVRARAVEREEDKEEEEVTDC
jgi:hypothetical protein